MKFRKMGLFAVSMVLLLVLCSLGANAQQDPFVNDSDNINVLGRWSPTNFPSNGAVTDYNNDTYKDLFVSFFGDRRGTVLTGYTIANGHPIFNSTIDFLFGESGISPGCLGFIFADFNNDGHSDIYVPNISGHQLFKYNPGTGQYEDIAGSISTPGGFDSTISGSWGDYNNDGWIDLLLMKYAGEDGGRTYSNEQRLLVNNGGQGFTLTDGVITGIPNSSPGVVNALWCDFSGDGLVDLALIDSGAVGGATKYLKNEFNISFGTRYMTLVQTSEMIANYDHLSWPGNTAVAADANNDGSLDIMFHSDNCFGALITDTSGPDDCLPFAINKSGGTYGGGASATAWNIGAFDYNLDGNMDFLGLMCDDIHDRKTSVFINRSGQSLPFNYGDWIEGFGSSWADKGLCLADFSKDGYTDVFLSRPQTGIVSNAFYWTTRPADTNYDPWIGIELFAPGANPQPGDLWFCNYDCIGATVIVHAGDHIQAQIVDGGSGRARQADRSLIFGLEGFQESEIDYVEVSLPNGDRMKFFDLAVNEVHKIPVNGVELVSDSMEFSIEHNEDDTQDWVVTWGTSGITDSSKDRVLFYVESGDEIVANNYNFGQAADLGGVSSVSKSGSEYIHTVRLDRVTCEAGRSIVCFLWSSSGQYTLMHQFPVKRIKYCLVSN